MVLRRITTGLGFEVCEAGNGREALDYLASVEDLPTVALVDWNMPEMDGLEFVTYVRAEPRLRDITLIMVTTESEQGQIVRALAAGAHEYVIKPFTSEAIGDKLALLGIDASGALS
jgi:two-component system chemotaxis response regulator CheY